MDDIKLTPKQREALEWLSKQRWVANWWGGKPHTGWPKPMPAATYRALSAAKLVKTFQGASPFERAVIITKDGRAALAAGD